MPLKINLCFESREATQCQYHPGGCWLSFSKKVLGGLLLWLTLMIVTLVAE